MQYQHRVQLSLYWYCTKHSTSYSKLQDSTGTGFSSACTVTGFSSQYRLSFSTSF